MYRKNSVGFTRGLVVGYVPNHKEWVIITDGISEIYAFIPQGVKPQIGETYSVSRQNSTFFLGNKVNAE